MKTYTEDQESISQWALATFGKESTPLRITSRAHTELSELIQVMTRDDIKPMDVRMECADISIVLCRTSKALGFDQYALMEKHRVIPYEDWWHIGQVMYHFATLCDHLSDPLTKPGERVAWLLGKINAHLAALATNYGGVLREDIDMKMDINRNRQWKLDGHGHGQHVA